MEREVYTTRAAQAAGLTPEAMRLEVERALRRKLGKERKALRRRELNPAVSVQPQERGIRYTNVRSAMAEEGVLRLLLKDESVFPEEAPPAAGGVFLAAAGPGCLTACGSCGRRDGPSAWPDSAESCPARK